MKRQIFKHAKKFLPLIGIIILIYIIYSLNIEDIKSAILSINPIYIVLALSLTLPRVLIRNYSWQLIQKEQKINIKFWRSLKIFLIGYFYCSITPGYVGHLMRVPYMKEQTNQPYGKLFVNVIFEVVLKAISLYAMITIGLILIIGTYVEILNISIFWAAIVVITALLLFYLYKKERGEKLFYFLIDHLVPKKLKKDFKDFVKTFYTDFPRVKKLILPIALGAITWIIIFSQEYIIVIALGLNIPYLYFLLLFPIANIIGFIPVTFAGIGTREAASILIFTTLFVVSKEEMLVVSLLGFVLTDIFTGFIGFLLSLTETKTKKVASILKSS